MVTKFRCTNRTHGDSAERTTFLKLFCINEQFKGAKNPKDSYKFAKANFATSPISSSGRASALQAEGGMFKSFIGHDGFSSLEPHKNTTNNLHKSDGKVARMNNGNCIDVCKGLFIAQCAKR